jgi:hypothetical protein
MTAIVINTKLERSKIPSLIVSGEEATDAEFKEDCGVNFVDCEGAELGGGVFPEVCGVFFEVCGVFPEVCGVFFEVCGVFSEVCGGFSELDVGIVGEEGVGEVGVPTGQFATGNGLSDPKFPGGL